MAAEASPNEATRRYYEQMSRTRARVVRPLVVFVLVFYFTLPILTNFTSALDGLAYEGFSWAYLYGFAQFVMVIVVTTYYRRVMDEVEHRSRPAEADESAAHYDDWQVWEQHEAEVEAEEEKYS
jgi:uncharacterized membrane protein (DUF485 family)